MIRGTLNYQPGDASIIQERMEHGKIMPLWQAALFASIFGALLGGAIGILLNRLFAEALPEDSTIPFWTAIAGQLICVPLAAWQLVLTGQRRQSAIAQEPQEIQIDEQGIRLRTTDIETHIGWPAIARSVPENGLLILVLKNRSVLLIRPSDFPDHNWQEVTGLIAKKTSQASRPRSLI